jgi:hypothetical protein
MARIQGGRGQGDLSEERKLLWIAVRENIRQVNRAKESALVYVPLRTP